jgi:FkbM family methyltransferase
MKRWITNELLQLIVLRFLYRKTREFDFVINNDWIGYNIILNGYYEKDQLSEILKHLDFNLKNFELLDIGANIGNHTVFFSKFFKHVHSFEPQLRTFEILKLNTSRLGNVSLNNFGISTENKQVVFKVPFNNSGAASELDSNVSFYEEIVMLKNIESIDLYSNVSVIKIDVEGSELDVINSCKELINLTKPVILFELNESSDHSVVDALMKSGYTNFYSQGKLELMSKYRGGYIFHKIFRLILRGIYYKKNKIMYEIKDFKKIDYPLVIASHPNSKFQFSL